MIKARICIFDDENPEHEEVYENFEMLPTDQWEGGTFQEQTENYRFSFVFTKLKEKRKE